MRRRINSRSKGLLEVKGLVSTPEGVDYDPRNFESCTVQYLHRTVKDYIEDDDVQKTLKSAMRSTFDPHLRLLAGRLASMKGMNLRGTLPAFMSEHFIKCLESARVVLPSNIPKMILLLDEMKKIGSLTFPALVANRRIQEAENSIPLPTKYDSWDFWLMSSLYLDLEKAPSGIDDAFLSLAVVFGIVEYVRIKVGLGCLIQKRDFLPLPDMPRYVKWPLLMDVITLRGFGIGDSRHHVLALPMIQCLLDKGADPNYKVSRPYHSHETSPLIESVSLLMSSVDYWKLRQPWVEGRRLQFWVEVTRLLIRAGRIDNDTVDRAIHKFLAAQHFILPKYRFGIFTQWNRLNSARKSLSKALQELARGQNPDFRLPVVKIMNLYKRLD